MSSTLEHALSALRSTILDAGNALVSDDSSSFDRAFNAIRDHRVVRSIGATMSSSSDAFGEMVEEVGTEVPFVRDFLGGGILMGIGGALFAEAGSAGAFIASAFGFTVGGGVLVVTIVALCLIVLGFSRAAPSLFRRAMDRLKEAASEKLSLD